MTKDEIESMAQSTSRLAEACDALERTIALFKMSTKKNPYYPLVRVLCKLNVVKDWPIY